MEIKFSKSKIELSRQLSGLDYFVLDFVKILKLIKINYVIVSGYIAILFGRSRGTEDVDIFIEDIEKPFFDNLVDEIEKRNLWIINTSSKEEAFDMLKDGISIRIAKKDMGIPNIEIKISKSALEKPLVVSINNNELLTSKIERQIAFKFWLGSDKDVEDAVYLYEIFKEKLDRKILFRECKELNVLDKMNKYAG